jgi:serine/threonine protein kinase/WD40 repeat protein
MTNLAGQTIKGYELLERIGAGGFGAVYRAYQSTIGREVAVKVILPGYANHPEFIRRFEMEAQLVARLEHLHIVPLYDYWRDPDGAYLVMRWLRGGNLQQAIRKDGPYNLEAAALLLDQVASALAAAHNQGVIHCDLKPSNILLDEEGNAYLADFSIARILRKNETRSINEEAIADLQNAISPEEALSEPVTPQSDIYSLGVLLYEILTGQHPFPELTSVQRFYKHLNDPLPRIENLNPAVHEGINQVIQRATAKNPEHRFRDALEMVAAFRAAAQIDGALTAQAEALTQREEDILHRIVDGLSNKEIAQDLFIELTTVKWYITQIYRKLGVRTRKQAIARAQETRLLTSDEEGETATKAVSVALPEPVNPYKGLRAFDTSDARDFFGREELIERLLARLSVVSTPSQPVAMRLSQGTEPALSLSKGRFLAIVGPSGSGKSSLVKAGLIPAIVRGELPGSEHWFVVQLVPGIRPLDQMEIALTRIAADQSANLRQHLERDAYGLQRAAELILPRNDSELLIVIDQFEEVFTLLEDETMRSHVLALLSMAVNDPHSRVRILLTLRADYYDRPLHYPEFGDLLRHNMETVLPLSAEELERAILRPSEQVGVGFEPGLLATIIDDVKYQPGALPLLQYALTELFEGRDGHLLTHAAYQAIGGTSGALASRAEELYQDQDARGREAIRQIFLRLVALDDAAASAESRRRTARSELTEVAQDEELTDEIVDTFVAYRLLTLDHDPGNRRPMVEVAHEALLHEWGRLRAWVDESRADLRMQRQLAQAAEEWRQAGKDPSFVLHGTHLNQFESWSQGTELALTEEECDYLKASVTLRQEQESIEFARQVREAELKQRARRVLQALVVVFLLAAVISGWFALAANRNLARSESQRLAAEASNVLHRGGSPELAALLALRGLDAYYTPQADMALQRSASVFVDSVVIKLPDVAIWPMLSPDNRYLRFMRFGPGGFTSPIVEVWDLQAMERLWQTSDYIIPGFPFDNRGATAENAALVAGSLDDREVLLLDVETGERILNFRGISSTTVTGQISGDGKVVIGGESNGDVHVWRMDTGEEIRRFSVGGGGYGRGTGLDLVVGVSPDSRLAVATAVELTRIWDIKSGEELYRFEHEHFGWWNPPQFADDGRLLLAAIEPVVSLWDLSTGQEVKLDLPTAPVGVLSPDGDIYAQGLAGRLEQGVILWEVATGRELHRLTSHSDGGRPVDFLDGGRQLVTWGWEGTARVWDVASGRELLVLAGHTDAIEDAALSPDERFLVTTGQDATVRIWDLQAPIHQDYQIGGARDVLQLSPDGRVALTLDLEAGEAVLVKADSFEVLHHLDFMLDPVFDGGKARPPFSSDSQMVLGDSLSGTILVYDVASGELIGEHTNPDGVYKHPVFVPGSNRIFAGGDRGAYLLDAESGEQLQVFDTPDKILSNQYGDLVAVSSDGRYGAMHAQTSGSQHVVYLWDLETGNLEFQSTPSDWIVVAFAFSEDSHYFAWGGTDNVAYVLDLHSGEEVVRLHHLDSVHEIDFSSDKQQLLTSTGGDGVILWDLESGEVVRRFYAGNGQAGFVQFVENDAFVMYSIFEDGVIYRQPVNLERLVENMCSRVLRDLTSVERQIYGLDDSPTCPKFAIQAVEQEG